MLENDKIRSCDWSESGGFLEYDLTYLHTDLEVLVQEYRINSMSYEGRQIYQSNFELFASAVDVPGNFSYLPKEVKMRLWEVIFAIKHKFFAEHQPDIVEHFIDGMHSIERRYELYRAYLSPPGYTIEVEKAKRTITYLKQLTPTDGGRGFLLP